MIGLVDRKTYLLVAVGVALSLALIGTFFGEDITAFAAGLPGQVAPGLSGLAAFIVEPVKFVMLNPIVGGIIAGILWPLALVWLLLILVVIVFSAAGQVQTDVDTQTPLEIN